ncbi:MULTISPECIES: TerD family protein [Streptomyces]|jgi:stress response protein SCP2|uniref:Stress response protein SCP2 n=1 Tax=Streptomyces nymphaeiformis TaxID=2663842 RepID=A0A7W7X9T7_9ACTN|nr:TerD family protein [Streptomyces nymphaeiformis]MBB4980207.1 stress response protein SCP2 [Streptomyces nymphaeiformis]
MTAMTPGSNIPLTAARVAVDVAAPVRLDVSGLLLGANGKVRSDDDFIFYNQPAGPGVTYRSGGGAAPDAILVDTGALPAGIERIVVTASPDAAGQTFQGIEPTATIRNADDGSVIATFTPPQLATETALVVVEIYLRNGAWKARAVGQGYANGLAGIATDFGVSVDDEPAAAPAPAPVAAAPVAPPVPPAPPAAPVDPRVAASVPPAPAAAPAAGPVSTGKINLDKGRVSLQKNQTVSLVKGGRPLLSQVKMGLGWEPAYRGKDIDLDASVIAYGPQRNHLDSCYFGKLSILNGSIKHSGDNLTGEGAGDDEVITVDLGRLPADATGLVFTVNSFSGQKFTEVAKAYCRLLDAATGEELVRFDLTTAEPQTGVMMAKLIKQFSGEWEMTAMGEFVKSRTVRGMVKPAAQAL